MFPQTYVSKSLIQGKGLFAGETIGKDTIIGWVKNVACRNDGRHVLWITEETGYKVLCNLRYINHSDHPHACYYDDLSVVAIRDIRAHDEITHNYDCQEW